jgi:tetratricopeptide (TPR) repeat protein
VLAQLSVFRGGFTRRAAQAVVGATLRELKGLVNKSLVDHTTTGRYQLHELLRQYAADKLRRAESLAQAPERLEATRDRHGAYYAGFLARRAEQLKGPRQLAALTEIEADAENARAAWNWAVERGQAEWLDQGTEGLCMFYEWRGRYAQGDRAGHRAAERLATMEGSDAMPSGCIMRVRALCLAWRGVFQTHLGDNESAQQLLQHSLSLLDRTKLDDHNTQAVRAFALRCLGNPALFMGHYEAARDLFQHSLALYRGLDDRWEMAYALDGVGWATWNLDEGAEAEGWHRESLALRRALGDQRGIANSLFAICQSVIPLGRPEEGENLAREAIAISRETGDRMNLAWGLYGLGWALRESGKSGEAQSVLEESAAIWEDLGSPARFAFALADLGDALMHLGRYQDARAQLQQSLRLARETDYQLALECSFVYLGWVALGDEAYADARRWFQDGMRAVQSSGRRANMIRALAGLGFAERGLGNRRQAREHFCAGLETASDLGFTEWFLHCAGAMALLLADEGHKEQAVELYALVLRYPWVANSQWWEDIAGKQIAAVAATLPPDVVAAAQARGRARDLQATVRELLEELET